MMQVSPLVQNFAPQQARKPRYYVVNVKTIINVLTLLSAK